MRKSVCLEIHLELDVFGFFLHAQYFLYALCWFKDTIISESNINIAASSYLLVRYLMEHLSQKMMSNCSVFFCCFTFLWPTHPYVHVSGSELM